MNPLYENINTDDGSFLKCLNVVSKKLTDDHSWHYHPELEITCVVRGQGTLFIGDSVNSYAPGHVALIGADLPHCWIDDNENDEDNEILVLQFREAELEQRLVGSTARKMLDKVVVDATRGIGFLSPQSQVVQKLMWKTYTEVGLLRLSSFLELLQVIYDIKSSLFFCDESYCVDHQNFLGERMLDVVEFVQKNIASDIRQSDVALTLDMTPQSFSRFFRACTGRTFVSFVNAMRVARACQLLINSSKEITEIAFSCGYGNLSNFNRRFKEEKGVSPSMYRKQLMPIHSTRR